MSGSPWKLLPSPDKSRPRSTFGPVRYQNSKLTGTPVGEHELDAVVLSESFDRFALDNDPEVNARLWTEMEPLEGTNRVMRAKRNAVSALIPRLP